MVSRLGHPLLIVPDNLIGHGMEFFAGIVRHRLEGMMAKRLTALILLASVQVTGSSSRSLTPPTSRLSVVSRCEAKRPYVRCCSVRGIMAGWYTRERSAAALPEGNDRTFLAELTKAPKLQELVDCPSGSICRLPGWRCRVRYFGLTEMGHLRAPTFEGLV